MTTCQSYEIVVHGTVQGVGFRPFVYRLAKDAGICGSVTNTGTGVFINLFCSPAQRFKFIESIKNNLPPLARVSDITWSEQPRSKPPVDFTILKSRNSSEINTLIPQDSGLCRDCLTELFQQDNRRFGYPFINCTNCGPRFSLISALPYDRPNTSMKGFPLCEQCAKEYHDPGNRRFHAQPIGCWSCGPQLSWHDHLGRNIDSKDEITAAQDALLQGSIVAIKGIGGIHLAVDATNSKAMEKLRQRKGRKSKPLAIMVQDLATARLFAQINKEEETLLSSSKAPIVLLKKTNANRLPHNLAPGVAELGIMLPYTPLHHLLLQGRFKALVMTSANRRGEPLCIANNDAIVKLKGIADFFLLHNRDIVTRVDDSIVRYTVGKDRVLRRGRGYVPKPISLKTNIGKLLACGASETNTFCLSRGKKAFLGQHIGRLESPASLDFFKESLAHFQKIHEITPKAVCTDLHPDYLSSRYGKTLSLPNFSIQHHHAHAAAVIGEHGITGPVIAVIFDGTGLGPDKTIWGGEILYTDAHSFTRLGHIDHLLLPGGDAATRKPWKMALAMLWKIRHEISLTDTISQHLSQIPKPDIDFLMTMLQEKINSPKTSSCGRLFDGVAALIGQRMTIDYEAQAAMELEALAWQAIASSDLASVMAESKGYPPSFITKKGLHLLSVNPLILAIITDKKLQVSKEIIALKFHLWLINGVCQILLTIRRKLGQMPIVLSGGCMQNRLLFEGLFLVLKNHNFTLFAGENVPTNDGGISLGQAVIGGTRNVSSHPHAGH